MTSNLFHNNLAAELAAEREKTQTLQQELERVSRQRDNSKLTTQNFCFVDLLWITTSRRSPENN